MQFRPITAFLIFIGSYLPLAMIFAARDITEASIQAGMCTEFSKCSWPMFEHPLISLLIVLVTAACLTLGIETLENVRCRYTIEIISSRPLPGELISYTFPYIVAFMGIDYSDKQGLIGFAVFFIWLFWINYRAGQILMNPILLVFGWKLYEVTYRSNESELSVTILSKVEIAQEKYLCEKIQSHFICRGKSKR